PELSRCSRIPARSRFTSSISCSCVSERRSSSIASSLPCENCDAHRRGVPLRMPVEISQARTDGDYAVARTLFLEYAESLGFSLAYQGFDRELEEIATRYVPPS